MAPSALQEFDSALPMSRAEGGGVVHRFNYGVTARLKTAVAAVPIVSVTDMVQCRDYS